MAEYNVDDSKINFLFSTFTGGDLKVAVEIYAITKTKNNHTKPVPEAMALMQLNNNYLRSINEIFNNSEIGMINDEAGDSCIKYCVQQRTLMLYEFLKKWVSNSSQISFCPAFFQKNRFGFNGLSIAEYFKGINQRQRSAHKLANHLSKEIENEIYLIGYEPGIEMDFINEIPQRISLNNGNEINVNIQKSPELELLLNPKDIKYAGEYNLNYIKEIMQSAVFEKTLLINHALSKHKKTRQSLDLDVELYALSLVYASSRELSININLGEICLKSGWDEKLILETAEKI